MFCPFLPLPLLSPPPSCRWPRRPYAFLHPSPALFCDTSFRHRAGSNTRVKYLSNKGQSTSITPPADGALFCCCLRRGFKYVCPPQMVEQSQNGRDCNQMVKRTYTCLLCGGQASKSNDRLIRQTRPTEPPSINRRCWVWQRSRTFSFALVTRRAYSGICRCIGD